MYDFRDFGIFDGGADDLEGLLGSEPDLGIGVGELLAKFGHDDRETVGQLFGRTIGHVPQSPNLRYFASPPTPLFQFLQ